MSLMKHLATALVLCAIPAATAGQAVSCDDCTHVASVYMGEGGVIATADGADKVTWVAACGGVTRSGELAAGADGVVAALWTGDLACMAEKGGSFEIGPVKDGGWFWITDDMNSAVGGLVAKDVLKNDAADIASAGSGVTMTKGKGAVFLREAASGRVGILSNILPEPPVDALRKCGYTGTGKAGDPFKRLASDCALGDGVAQIIATVEDSFTGKIKRIPDGGTVARPAGTGSVEVTFDLWGNGSGHFRTDPAAPGNEAIRGHSEFLTTNRSDARLAGPTYLLLFNPGPRERLVGSDVFADEAIGGVSYTSNWWGVLTIRADSDHCSKTANYPLPIKIFSWLIDADAARVTPTVKTELRRIGLNNVQLAAEMTLTVVCPSG